MFELKRGQEYSIYNKTINKDPFEYHKYDLQKALKMNQHGMLELQIELKDGVLLGSSDSVKQTSEVINKFRLGFDKKALYKDAYKKCLDNQVCSDYIEESDSNILNYMYNKAYKQAGEQSMTNEQWEAAHAEAESYMEIAKNKSWGTDISDLKNEIQEGASDKWFDILD